MLILTRKLGESIAISNKIRVTPLEVQGKQVKIGVLAPPAVSIHRQEVYENIQLENHRGAGTRERDLDEFRRIFATPV